MATAFRTSPAGYALLQYFEGCKLTAYRPSPVDNWTIGWGIEGEMFPGTSGAIPVVEGLTITQQQADDALSHFVVNVVEPLVNTHFNPETQGEFDALVSWCYNIRHDKLNKGEYTLPTVFNRKPRDFDAIIEWWLKYVNPKSLVEQGLYRRRLAELCLMFGWPWKYAISAVLKRINGEIVERTDPLHILNLAEAASAPVQMRSYTTDELNARERARLAGEPIPEFDLRVPAKPLPKPPPPKAKPPAVTRVPTPQVDVTAPPKPMEDSKTHKGLSKAESGKETVIIGTTVTGIGALLPNVSALTNYLQQFPTETILKTVAIIGVIVIVIGLWRWYAGKMISYEGRTEATQTKV